MRTRTSATPRPPAREWRSFAAAAAALLAALASVLVGAVPAAAAKGVARVTLVHGVKGLVADVALDHKTVLSGFKFQHVTGVLDVPAGKHRIQIFKAGTKKNPALDVSVTFKAGQDVTAVAALGKGDKPTAFVFDNHLPAMFDGPRNVVLRNAAAAGSVAVRVDGKAKPGVAAGKQGVSGIAAGSHRLRVTNDSGKDVGNPFAAKVPAGRMLSLFVVGGTHPNDLFVVTAQQRPAGAAMKGVNTGGQPPSGLPLGLAAMALVATGVALMAVGLGRRRGPRRAATN